MSSKSASEQEEVKAESPAPSESSKKSVEPKPAPIKPASPKKQQQQQPKKVEEVKHKAASQTKEQSSKQHQQQQNAVNMKLSRFVHVLVIIMAAISVLVINVLSGFSGCKERIGADLCSAIQNSGYVTMISVFCAVEAEEFLFGRLSNAAGSPVDASLLAKDLVLFFFVLLLALQFQCAFNL